MFSNLAKFMGNYILNIISIIASTGIINIDFCDIDCLVYRLFDVHKQNRMCH